MPSDQKSDFWRHHVAAWRKSQLSQKVYCHQNDLSYAQFSYWRTKINKEKSGEPKFIPITTGQLSSSVTITLSAGKRSVRVFS